MSEKKDDKDYDRVDEILAESDSEDESVKSVDSFTQVSETVDNGVVDSDSGARVESIVDETVSDASAGDYSGAEPDVKPVYSDFDATGAGLGEDSVLSAPDAVSDYFDDDAEFLKGDDTVVHEDLSMSIIKQSDTVVSWRVDNLYKEDGTVRRGASMRNDPPVFVVDNSDGDFVSFVLTKEFAGQLESVMGDVYRAYFGVSPRRGQRMGEGAETFFKRLSAWAIDNKVKASIIGGLIAVFVLFAFVI